jgi:fatty acid desaturase
MSLPIPADELRTLLQRSDGPGMRRLAVHLGLIGAAAAGVYAARGTYGVWPAMALLGLFEVLLFAPHHEATHDTPFRSRWPTRWVGAIAGFLLILPPKAFRAFHIAHHRHAQDPVRDPELTADEPLTGARYAWRLTGIPLWIANVRELVATAAGRADRPWISPPMRPAIVREARTYLGAYALTALGAVLARTTVPLWLWIGPVLLGQPALRHLLLAEHAGCPRVADPWTNTRTTLAAAPLRYLFWNMNYHAEHHLVAGVPFHALPRLHALVGTRFANVARGYPEAHREIRSAFATRGRERSSRPRAG